MALHYPLSLLPKFTLFQTLPNSKPKPSCVVPNCAIRCHQLVASSSIIEVSDDQNNNNTCHQRRSANYFQPSIWHYDYIQSLKSDYVEESYAEEGDELKEEVRAILEKLEDGVDQLEVIDDLQRLGVANHFSHEIGTILKNIYNHEDKKGKKNNDLYATALEFRLLRQHGYDVSSEVFNGFLDHKGDFDSDLSDDILGLLALYEASFHSMEDESILEEARDFSSNHLKEFVNKNIVNENTTEIALSVELVQHSLELPRHWRPLRLEARWFIDIYERTQQNMVPTLLKLAKLDFNLAQVSHQEDLKHTSRWWKRIGFGEKLSFARDRLVENFLWTVGLASEAHLGHFRRVMTKVNALITTIDDIYDVYGTLEELQLFTYVVERWDINMAMEILPDYMKLCFHALYNFVNEVAFDSLKENGNHIIPHLQKAWADLCKSYLVEAKWYHSGYEPSFEEYMENAWVSISAPLILVHAYFLLTNSTKEEDFICLEKYSEIIRFSATILRLADDLGTSKREKETGDVAKSIECYMNETGASEADARMHINLLIWKTWKKMNKEVSNYSCNSKSFIEIALNLARMSLCMYQHGDGHSVQDLETKNRIMSLIFQPIDFNC
ncbi:terpene synthase 10-like [Senna tora]|uniref:Terpene synthase 10-like n=1 Tax=Senna tora TaxID=362788 RepID=A0A834T3J0_9FABA|nr:terpene synthase 10-like [Senna tora]